jgi:hypothetical protein
MVRHAGVLCQLWSIYLFLSLVLNVGQLLTIAQGFSAVEGFHRPLTASTSFKDAWGERWNMVIHGYLKSVVFKPCLRRGVPKLPTAVITFFASGLLHEYMYILHNAEAYVPGKVCTFFVVMGLLMLIEQYALAPLVPATLGRLWKSLPGVLTGTILGFLSTIPFDPLCTSSLGSNARARCNLSRVDKRPLHPSPRLAFLHPTHSPSTTHTWQTWPHGVSPE